MRRIEETKSKDSKIRNYNLTKNIPDEMNADDMFFYDLEKQPNIDLICKLYADYKKLDIQFVFDLLQDDSLNLQQTSLAHFCSFEASKRSDDIYDKYQELYEFQEDLDFSSLTDLGGLTFC